MSDDQCVKAELCSGETALRTDVHMAAIQEHDRVNELRNRYKKQPSYALWGGVQLIWPSLQRNISKDSDNLAMVTQLK